MRADLQRYYGLDLADLWRGTLHPRRVWQLTEHLPSDSALLAELSGGKHMRDWTVQTQLIAHLLNVVRIADVNNVRVSGGKAKNPKPIDVPSPSGAPKKPRIDLSRHPLAQTYVSEK